MKKKVIVAMSGGVDSSVSAALLKKDGFDVTGVFMKCWESHAGYDVGHRMSHMQQCAAEEDEMWARRAAAKIGVSFYSVDLVHEYKKRVFDYFISEYRAGRTPNPDVMCNREIKFGVFYDFAVNELGAGYIATGHYARTKNIPYTHDREYMTKLLKGKDPEKDQSYFLWAVPGEKFEKVIFPVGGYFKSEVRKMAHKFGLPNAARKDSQGICFVGDVEMNTFLREFLPLSPGIIVNRSGVAVGTHEGLHFYTLGQRRGLGVGGGLPYYVAKKNYATNTMLVAHEYDAELFKKSLIASNLNWIIKEPKLPFQCFAKLRYRQADQDAIIKSKDANGNMRVEFKEPQRAVTPGQSIVFYKGEELVGGGIIYGCR